MFGNLVIGSARKLNEAEDHEHDEGDDRRHRPADRPGGDVEPHCAASSIGPSADEGSLRAAEIGRTRRPDAGRPRPARRPRSRPRRGPRATSVRRALVTPALDLAQLDAVVLHHLDEIAVVARGDRARRHGNARTARDHRRRPRRKSRYAPACRAAARMRTLPSRVVRSTSSEISRTRPSTSSSTPGKRDLRLHAELEPRQGLLRHLGLELDRTVGDDAEERVGRTTSRRRRAAPCDG